MVQQVPAAIGDNMGDCVATTDVYMQGNDITGGRDCIGLGML